MKNIRVKVCGMKCPQNMSDLLDLNIDLMGMIFYPKSPRYIDVVDLKKIPSKADTKRVGVFVNEDIETVNEQIVEYSLDMVQLHGNESYEYCVELNKIVPIIKAFSIKDKAGIEIANKFGKLRGYYLFDTKTPNHGGSGVKFDWSVLCFYTSNMPFYLSGGISIDDVAEIKKIEHPCFEGVDLNSKFEDKPGLKNILLLKNFLKELRS